MKLSFSTLGCPEWTMDEVCEKGTLYGYQGVEIRGIHGELNLTRCPALGPDRRKDTLALCTAAGLQIAALGTSVKLCLPDQGDRESNWADGRRAIDLAAALGTDKIRVFGGQIPEGVAFADAEGWVVQGLKRLGDYAAPRRVFVLLETHDSFIRTDVVRGVMEKVGSEWVRVLWDVHHPFRMGGESIRESWENIGRYVAHTHFKDSRATDGEGHQLTLMGEGDVPVREALAVLKAGGYHGYLSLEWEKRWHPELPDATVAFPQYVEKMREYLSQLP